MSEPANGIGRACLVLVAAVGLAAPAQQLPTSRDRGSLAVRGLPAEEYPTVDDVDAALGSLEAHLLRWCTSRDPLRRSTAIRLLAGMASPRWPEARDLLLGDVDDEVRIALLRGVAWMGDDDPRSVQVALCHLGEPGAPGGPWPAIEALNDSGTPVDYARLTQSVEPLSSEGTRSVFAQLRWRLTHDDADLFRIIEDEIFHRNRNRLMDVDHEPDAFRGFLERRVDYTIARLYVEKKDVAPLRELAKRGETAAIQHLLEVEDQQFLDWLDQEARDGRFEARKDPVGNVRRMVIPWNSALPYVSDEALENILWNVRDGTWAPTLAAAAAELNERGKLPSTAELLEMSTSTRERIQTRVTLGLTIPAPGLLEAGLREAVERDPRDPRLGAYTRDLQPIALQRYVGRLSRLAPESARSLVDLCLEYWVDATADYPAERTQRRNLSLAEAAGLLNLAGVLAKGRDFDRLWELWQEEDDQELSMIVLRALLCSSDDRAEGLRRHVWRHGDRELRAAVQDAIAYGGTLERAVDSYVPKYIHHGYESYPAHDSLPLLSMLPDLFPVMRGPVEPQLVVELSWELPSQVKECLRTARRRDVVTAILRRCMVREDAALRDRRRTIRHLGWWLAVDRYGATSVSSALRRTQKEDDYETYLLQDLARRGPLPTPAPREPSSAQREQLRAFLDPNAASGHLSTKVAEIVERMRGPQVSSIGCGPGYREPTRVPTIRDPGFRVLGAGARDHVRAYLREPDPRVRHALATLLWSVFQDESGPKLLKTEAHSPDDMIRASALRHLAVIRWTGAQQLFLRALTEPDPNLQAAGLAGVERLGLHEGVPQIEAMVRGPDEKLSLLACAVLRRVHGPDSWRLLVSLLDHHDQRSAAALSALGGHRRLEVIRAVVRRLPDLPGQQFWAAQHLLASMTHVERPNLTREGNEREIVRFWKEWVRDNKNGEEGDWIMAGLGPRIARTSDMDPRDARKALANAGMILPAAHGEPLLDWLERTRRLGFSTVLWAALERQAIEGFDHKGLELLQQFFPGEAPGLLVRALRLSDDVKAEKVHTALTELTGVDLGNPTTVVPELRAPVVADWERWLHGQHGDRGGPQ